MAQELGGNTFAYWFIIKELIKDTNAPPGDVYVALDLQGCQWSLGCTTDPAHGCFTNPEALQTP